MKTGTILKCSDAAFTYFLMVTGQSGNKLECFFLTAGGDDDAMEKDPRSHSWTVELTPEGNLPPRTEVVLTPSYSTAFPIHALKDGKQGKRRYYREDAYED